MFYRCTTEACRVAYYVSKLGEAACPACNRVGRIAQFGRSDPARRQIDFDPDQKLAN